MTKHFPAPAGPHPIGLFDGAFSYGNRRLCYRAFFPADTVSGPAEPYLTPDMLACYRQCFSAHPLAGAIGRSGEVQTNGYRSASPAPGPFPVIIYQHGMGAIPWGNLAQIEHLVSSGAVVFALIHPGDTFWAPCEGGPVPFDTESYGAMMGQLTAFMLKDKPDVFTWSEDELGDYIRKCTVAGEKIKLWRADTSAMVDEILRLSGEGALKGRMKTQKIGAFGYAFGGAASVEAAHYDPRIAAGINIDGFQLGGTLLDHVTDTPCAYITKSALHYTGNYGRNNPLVACIELKGSSNMYLCDYCHIATEEVQKIDYPTPTLTPEKMTDDLNHAVAGFFRAHL